MTNVQCDWYGDWVNLGVACSTVHAKQITGLLHDLPWSLWNGTIFMVTGNTHEEGTLLLKFFQWLVFYKAPPMSFQLGLWKAFNNGLFLQQNKLMGTFTTAFSEHLTKVNKKLQFSCVKGGRTSECPNMPIFYPIKSTTGVTSCNRQTAMLCHSSVRKHL